MTPFQRKIKSLGHAKYLPIKIDNLPSRLDKEELEKLVVRLKELKYQQRTEEFIEIRNKIVESHMKLALSIAARFGYISKRRIDDLVGEAFLILIEYTKKASLRLRDNNITPYLISSLHGDLSKFISEDKLVHISERSIRDYFAKGKYKKLSLLPRKSNSISDDLDSNEENKHKGMSITPQVVDDKSESEVMEILNKVTNNFIERRIIELRAQGYSYVEIEPLVGFKKSSISSMVQSIEERFNKKYKASS